MTRIGLIRHGHTAWNRAGRIQGRTDKPLEQDAILEHEALHIPAGWTEAQVITSPLMRTQQTARALIGNDNFTTDDRLIEMNWGDWEGQQGKVLKATPDSGFKDIEDWGWNYHAPNGESPADLRTRLQPLLKDLQQQQKDTVIVSHIGIMRILLAMAHGHDFYGPPPFAVKRRRIFVITLTSEGKMIPGDIVRLEKHE